MTNSCGCETDSSALRPAIGARSPTSAGPRSARSTGCATTSTGSRAGNPRPALVVVDDAGLDAVAQLRRARAPLAPGRELPARARRRPGDRVLIMLGNVVPLWETMLAVIRLGAVMIPATTLLAARRPRRPPRARRGQGGDRRRRARAALRGPRRRAASGSPSAAAPPAGSRTPRATAAAPRVRAGGADPGRRPAAALFHVRHHRAAEAGRAHPRELPGRPPVDAATGWASGPATCTST